MSYTNGTTHYNLPQTVGTDKRDWTDTNQAFADIDSALHTAYETASTGATNIQNLQTDLGNLTTRVTNAEGDITTNSTNIGLIQTSITNINSNITDVRQDAEDMICAKNESTATSTHAYSVDDYFIYNDVLYKCTVAIAVGDTIIPNTNCKATNVTTELTSGGTVSVDAEDVTYSNTSSGLTATDVQSAIDEVNTNNTANNFGTPVDIKSYTSTLYECPSDGYVYCWAGGGSSGQYCMISIYGNNATATTDTPTVGIMSRLWNGTDPSSPEVAFVRKGMKLAFTSNATTTYATYTPIE